MSLPGQKKVVSNKGLWPQQLSLSSTMPTQNRGTALAVFWQVPHHLQAGPEQRTKPNFTDTILNFKFLPNEISSDSLPEKTRLRSCRSGLGGPHACCGWRLAQEPLQWTVSTSNDSNALAIHFSCRSPRTVAQWAGIQTSKETKKRALSPFSVKTTNLCRPALHVAWLPQQRLHGPHCGPLAQLPVAVQLPQKA